MSRPEKVRLALFSMLLFHRYAHLRQRESCGCTTPCPADRSSVGGDRRMQYWNWMHPLSSEWVVPGFVHLSGNVWQMYWEILSRWQSFPWFVKGVPQNPNKHLYRSVWRKCCWQICRAGRDRTHAGKYLLPRKWVVQVFLPMAWKSSS